MEMPPGVRQVLRDAHARLGGAACGAKRVVFCYPVAAAATMHVPFLLDRHGRGPVQGGIMRRVLGTALREARMEGQPMRAVCRDGEAVQLAGLEPGSRSHILLEAHLWRLEGLAWQQRRQRRRGREGGKRWERRGGAGRRGRRRREPGVVFELSAWGEEAARALSHEEAAQVLVQALGV